MKIEEQYFWDKHIIAEDICSIYVVLDYQTHLILRWPERSNSPFSSASQSSWMYCRHQRQIIVSLKHLSFYLNVRIMRTMVIFFSCCAYSFCRSIFIFIKFVLSLSDTKIFRNFLLIQFKLSQLWKMNMYTTTLPWCSMSTRHNISEMLKGNKFRVKLNL